MANETSPTPARSAHPWWKSGVFYHIYPRSFLDSNGDGIGDLAGIVQRLDYLNDGKGGGLGVDAIWLSPVYPSPQKDFGYDISDYQAIDPTFGDMTTFRRLLEGAHARGIKVIMDLVVNHTSDQHPWFRESRSSRRNGKRDWYVWRDGKGRNPPNNWASTFGSQAWTLDEVSGQYYLHSFLKEQPDLNWRNPAVQEAIYNMMRFWLDMGVDGFRLDVYNCYVKDAELRDNPRRASPEGLFYSYMGQHHYHDRDQPEVLDVLRKMRELVDSYGDRVLVGETMDERGTYAKAVDYYGKNNDGLHLVFNFELLRSDWKPALVKKAITQWASSLPAWAWPTWVLGNHDFPRFISRYKAPGDELMKARTIAAIQLTLRGTPFVYYGEEIGMLEGKLARRDIVDPPGQRFWPVFKGRDGCRTPMQWDASPNAGFTTGRPWLPVNDDYPDKNVQAERKNRESLLQTYKILIRLRKTFLSLQRGSFLLLAAEDPNVLAYRRDVTFEPNADQAEAGMNGDEMLIIANLGHEVARFTLPGENVHEIRFSTHRDTGGPLRPGTVWLFPYETLIASVPAIAPNRA